MRSYAAVFGLVSAALPRLCSAHGFVSGVTVNGVWTNGSDPVWYYYPEGTAPATAGWNALNQDNGFVAPDSFGTADIACHKSAAVGKDFVEVNAGDTITFFWNTWPDSHKGPIINYLAPYGTTAGSLQWTKISQSGIVSGTTWVTDELIANNFTSATAIPRNLAAGDYVIRHEIIALHGANNANGAQAYPQCLNLRVAGGSGGGGGGGSVALPAGTAGAGLYKSTDAGVNFNLYTSYDSYPYPGPQLWTAAN